MYEEATHLELHIKAVHNCESNLIECQWEDCNCKGSEGFSCADHYAQHLQRVHDGKTPKRTDIENYGSERDAVLIDYLGNHRFPELVEESKKQKEWTEVVENPLRSSIGPLTEPDTGMGKLVTEYTDSSDANSDDYDDEWILKDQPEPGFGISYQAGPSDLNETVTKRRVGASGTSMHDTDIVTPQKWIRSLEETEVMILRRSSFWENILDQYPEVARDLQLGELEDLTIVKDVCPAKSLREFWSELAQCPIVDLPLRKPSTLKNDNGASISANLTKPTKPRLPSRLVPTIDQLNMSLGKMIRVCANIEWLQSRQICEEGISLFVYDRADIASLVFLSLTEISALTCRLFRQIVKLVAVHSTSQPGQIKALDQRMFPFRTIDLFKKEKLDAVEIIGYIKDLSSFWSQLAWSLDVATISYCGSHLVNTTNQCSLLTRFHDLLSRPQGEDISYQMISLSCMSDFLKGEKIWVLTSCSDRIAQPTILSTSIVHLADIWGPIWKLSSRYVEGNGDRRFYYTIGTGAIGRAPVSSKAEARGPIIYKEPINDEILCHFVPDISRMENELLPFVTDAPSRLLIGASFAGLEGNTFCRMQQIHGLSDVDLRVPGTSLDTRYKTASTYNMTLSYSGVQVGYTRQYKLRHGTTLKEKLLTRWSVEPENRDFGVFALTCGLEISICTRNAVRRKLWDILSSPTVVQYLELVYSAWDDEECAKRFYEALQHPSYAALSKLYIDNPRWRRVIGRAIALFFDTLSGTGFSSTGNLEAFTHIDYSSANPGKTATFLGKQYTWAGFLKDSACAATFAIATPKCLPFVHDSLPGQRCRMEIIDREQYSVLETFIVPRASPGTSLDSQLSKSWVDGLLTGKHSKYLATNPSNAAEVLKVIERLPNNQLVVRWSDKDFLKAAAGKMPGVSGLRQYRESDEEDEYRSITGARVYVISKRRNELPLYQAESLASWPSGPAIEKTSSSLPYNEHW